MEKEISFTNKEMPRKIKEMKTHFISAQKSRDIQLQQLSFIPLWWVWSMNLFYAIVLYSA